MEETSKETVKEEKKNIAKLPKEEQFPWALLTGSFILQATGLLTILQGLDNKDATAQMIMYASAVLVFAIAGYFMHAYNRWLIRQAKA